MWEGSSNIELYFILVFLSVSSICAYLFPPPLHLSSSDTSLIQLRHTCPILSHLFVIWLITLWPTITLTITLWNDHLRCLRGWVEIIIVKIIQWFYYLNRNSSFRISYIMFVKTNIAHIQGYKLTILLLSIMIHYWFHYTLTEISYCTYNVQFNGLCVLNVLLCVLRNVRPILLHNQPQVTQTVRFWCLFNCRQAIVYCIVT